MNRNAKKKRPLNQQRRMKQMQDKEPKKTRGKMPPPTTRHKDKRRDKRQDTKRKMREHTGMDRNYIASELKLAAKDMAAGRIRTKYNYSTEKKASMIVRLLGRLKQPASRLAGLDSFSINDEEKVHAIYDKLMDINHEFLRLGT